MRKGLLRALLWVLTLGLMATIFGFSGQDGETSMSVSAVIAVPIADTVSEAQGGLVPEAYDSLLADVQWAVRKTAHFSEYALLGALICMLMSTYPIRRPQPWAWLAATLYAASDELHQLFSGERTGMWQDVLLDSLGALTGILAVWLTIRFCRRMAAKRAGQQP